MISKEQVIHIANLARLELTEQEIEKMQDDLAEILGYIDILNKVDPVRSGASNGVDTSKVDLSNLNLVLNNALRNDEAKPETSEVVDKMLSQAPVREGNHIKVKEILT